MIVGDVPAEDAGTTVKGLTDMQDIIYVGIPIAFFALCVAYVRGLDRLVRGGDQSELSTGLADGSDGTSPERAEVWS
jgi:hypothetical protein